MEEINSLRLDNNKTVLIVILFVFLFFWYAQLTNLAGGPISFVKKSFSNIGNMFNEDVQVEGNSPLQNILLFSKKVEYNKRWIEYNNEVKEEYINKFNTRDFYTEDKTERVSQNLITPQGLKPNINYSIDIFPIKTLFDFLGRLFIVLGVLLFFVHLRKSKKNAFLNIVGMSFLIFLVITVFLPFFSISYDLTRFYQQFLIILALFCPLGLFFILRSTLKDKSYFIIALFFVLYIFIFLGIVYQLIGGISSTTRLNNVGFEYDSKYVHKEELSSALWFVKVNYNADFYLDNYANLRFTLIEPSVHKSNTFHDLIPKIINKNSYVYASYTNLIKGVTIKSYNVMPLSFNFPTKFLNDNKNKVYNNGGSEIFK